MIYILVPLSFLLGGVAGGLLAWTWRGRGGGGPDSLTRRHKITLVAATVLATILFLGVSGYAYIRLKLGKSDMKPASQSEALADFRKGGGGGAAHRAGMPPGGVYTFHTKGFIKAESALLGKENRPMPESIPAVLVPKGDCWELTLRIFDKHRRTERYCKDASAGLHMEERWEDNEVFGVKSFTRQKVTPTHVMDPGAGEKPGSTWQTLWKVVEHTTSSPLPVSRPDLNLKVTYVAREELDIGGVKVPAHRLQQSTSFGGLMRGRMDRDVWYAVDSGMLLKLTIKSTGSGVGSLIIDQHFTLASITPQK